MQPTVELWASNTYKWRLCPTDDDMLIQVEYEPMEEEADCVHITCNDRRYELSAGQYSILLRHLNEIGEIIKKHEDE